MAISIQLNNIGKRYIREWIFRKIDLTISQSDKIVLLGSNGSGKSTLLQIISNYQLASEGKITYLNNNKEIEEDKIYQHLSIASPYMELIEDYSPIELIQHQSIYKPFFNQLNPKQILEIAELNHVANKYIKYFSSGMKQRIKIALAVLADCPLLFLDEPVSNLDKEAIAWYKNLIKEYAMNKTIIVCSNKITDEYEFCQKEINIEVYK